MTAARFIVVLAAVFSVSMAYGVTLPVLPFVVERIVGVHPTAIAQHTGMLTGVYTFALFIFSPLWGTLSDRVGRRAIIVVGLLGSCVSLLLLDAAGTLAMLYVARAASGVLSAAVLPCVLADVAESFDAPARPRAFAIISSAATLGFLVGPATGSWLSAMVLAPIASMRIAGLLMMDSPFVVIALANMLSAMALVLVPAAPLIAALGASKVAGKLTSVDQSRIFHGLILTCITVFCITVAEVGITLLGKQVLSLGPDDIAKFFMLCGAVMIFVQIAAFPVCMRKLTLQALIAASLLISMIGLATIPYARGIGIIGVASENGK